jgi:electron transfer flavoprotein beta subunit
MNATGQMLSALLGWSQVTYASKITVDGDTLNVTREVDDGLQNVTAKLPAVISADLRLNEPRYVKLPNIMKAKKKPLDIKTPEDYGVDISPRLTVKSVVEPPPRAAGIKVESVTELLDKLKNEAGVLS